MTIGTKKVLHFAFIFLIISTPWAITYFVSPTGNDSQDGSEGSPFLTLHKARDALRLAGTGEKIVIVRGGNYFLESTLTFTEEDNGTAQYPVTYKNYPGETPFIFGGKRITGWEQAGSNTFRAKVDANWEFWTLSENGYRAQPARFPNDDASGSNNGAFSGFSNSSFTYHSSFPAQWDYSHARVQGDAHGWFPDCRPIKSVDFGSRIVTCTVDSYGDNRSGYYIIEGSKDFIDQEGEWAQSNDGYVYYRPIKTPIQNQVIVGASMLRVIEFKGSSPSACVKHITIQGMVLSTSDCQKIALSNKQRIADPSDQPGEGNCEGDHMRQGLVHLENAEFCSIRYCKILNAGVMGVMINYHAKYNAVYGCWLEGINYHAVCLNSYCAWIGPFEYNNRHNKIVNNYFTDFGMLLANGSAVQLHQSGDNDICHNEIAGGKGGRRYAISAKGNARVPSTTPCTADPLCYPLRVLTRNNSFNYNFISNVQRTTRDVGAFEAWRSGWNNSIIHNCFHDMVDIADWSHDTRRHCIYLDDSDHYTITRNLFYNIVMSTDFGTKSFSAQMKFNDPEIVADKVAALAIAAEHPLIEFEAIGVLSDFPWDPPMGKSNRTGYPFNANIGNGTGLLGEYYNNLDLSGAPSLTRIDEIVNFIWGKSEWPVFHTHDSVTVIDTIGINNLSIRWTGKVVPLFSETYSFYTTANDGVRLWIDGQQLIDEWNGGMKEPNASVALISGRAYDIKLEYKKEPGGRHKGVQLRWQSPSQYYTLVPKSQLYSPTTVSIIPNSFQRNYQHSFTIKHKKSLLQINFASGGNHCIRFAALNGRIIMQQHGAGKKHYDIQTGSLPKGLYLMNIIADAQSTVEKVLVE